MKIRMKANGTGKTKKVHRSYGTEACVGYRAEKITLGNDDIRRMALQAMVDPTTFLSSIQQLAARLPSRLNRQEGTSSGRMSQSQPEIQYISPKGRLTWPDVFPTDEQAKAAQKLVKKNTTTDTDANPWWSSSKGIQPDRVNHNLGEPYDLSTKRDAYPSPPIPTPLLSADFSEIEARVLAHMSGADQAEKKMRHAFRLDPKQMGKFMRPDETFMEVLARQLDHRISEQITRAVLSIRQRVQTDRDEDGTGAFWAATKEYPKE